MRLVAERWRPTHPHLAERLEEDIEDCLACLAFPASHQRRIRTTNGLERVSQELKRRTRVVRIFPNREACLRLVTALAAEISEDWESGRRYSEHGGGDAGTADRNGARAIGSRLTTTWRTIYRKFGT